MKVKTLLHSKKVLFFVFLIIYALTFFISKNNSDISTPAFHENIIIYDEEVPLSPIASNVDSTFEISTYTETEEELFSGAEFDAYQTQMLDLINNDRESLGLNKLELKADLISSSLIRSKEIETLFSHTRPDGRYFNTAIHDINHTYNGCGENVAYGFRTVESVYKAWMNSEGHRKNILNSKFKYFGFGYYKGSNGYDYWTQHFAY